MSELLINASGIIMNDHTVFARNNKLTPKRKAYIKVYEEILKCHPIESILNIGIGPGLSALKWNSILFELWPSLTYLENLELDDKIVNKAKKSRDPLICNIQLGDVKQLSKIYSDNSFDLIYWNQGPEHIYREEWKDTFKQLDRVATKAIYMHCPWGIGYDSDKGHYSKNIQSGEFEQLGFTCVYHGKKDSKNCGIMSYKIL